MLGNVEATQARFRVSGSESSNGPGEHGGAAARAAAEVAVEDRAGGEVPLDCDAPRPARERVVGDAGGAAVDERLRLIREVVVAEVGAVGVRVRNDEQLHVLEQRGRGRVGAVVAQQALDELDGGERRDPLAAVRLGEDEDADPGAVPVHADPQQPLLEWVAGNGARGRQEVRQGVRRGRDRVAGAGVAAVRLRRDQRGGRHVGVDRRDHLGGRAGQRTAAVGRQADGDQVPDRRRPRAARSPRRDPAGARIWRCRPRRRRRRRSGSPPARPRRS